MASTQQIGSGENVVISESIVAPIGEPAVDIIGDNAMSQLLMKETLESYLLEMALQS